MGAGEPGGRKSIVKYLNGHLRAKDKAKCLSLAQHRDKVMIPLQQ